MLEKLHEFLYNEVVIISGYFREDFTELKDGENVIHSKRVTEKTVKEAFDKAMLTGKKEDIREAVELRGCYDYQDGKRVQAEKCLKSFWKIVNGFNL